MRTRLALLALFLLCGCRTDAAAPAAPAPSNDDSTSATSTAPSFVGKAWMAEGSKDLPGVLRIFLPDGTLVMDSCWETYRLAQWRMDSAGKLVITEDTMEIPAEVLAASDAELKLRLTLVDGTKDETYRPAPVPYVCPDMPR